VIEATAKMYGDLQRIAGKIDGIARSSDRGQRPRRWLYGGMRRGAGRALPRQDAKPIRFHKFLSVSYITNLRIINCNQWLRRPLFRISTSF
jgi:hypothetical protein